LRNARLWDVLAEECEFPDRPLQRIILQRDAETADGSRRHVLKIIYRRKLRLPAVPTIYLDADLSEAITRKFLPDCRIVDIPVCQSARVIQIVDKTVSRRFCWATRPTWGELRAVWPS